MQRQEENETRATESRPTHETKGTIHPIRLRKLAGHAVFYRSRGVAIGGAAEVWAGGRPMAIRRPKRRTDATAGETGLAGSLKP